MGGTFMRQNTFIFDVEKNWVGVARASCNHDPNQIKDEQEMITVGHQRYGLDPTDTASANQKCQHGRSVTNEEYKKFVGPNSENGGSPLGIKVFVGIAVILILIGSGICLYRKWSKSKNGM